MKLLTRAVVFLSCVFSVAAHSSWVLDDANSQINFVSIKKNSFGEIHSFGKLRGAINVNGYANLTIDLSSVSTGIDIRDKRLKKHFFEIDKFATATASIHVDVKKLEGVNVGSVERLRVDAKVHLHGLVGTVPMELMVVKKADKSLLVSTVTPFIINAANFDLDAGVDKLKELAALPNIAYSVPVTALLVFKQQ